MDVSGRSTLLARMIRAAQLDVTLYELVQIAVAFLVTFVLIALVVGAAVLGGAIIGR